MLQPHKGPSETASRRKRTAISASAEIVAPIELQPHKGPSETIGLGFGQRRAEASTPQGSV